MKVKYNLLIIGQLPPPHHGSNVMTDIFIKSLTKLGYTVTFVEKKFSNHIEEVRRPSLRKIFKVPLITTQLISQLIKMKFDFCVYFLSIDPPSIFIDALFLFLVRLFRVKYILYLHAKGLINLNEKISWPIRSIIKKIISLSSGAIVLGEKLRGDINYLIPNERVFTLPNAISDTEFRKIDCKCNAGDSIKILYLSNLMPSKGPLEFLKMAKKINQINKKVHFNIAGPKMSDRFFNKIKEFINNGNLNDYITLIGPVYGTQKEKLFLASDIFVFPTFYKLEAFPLVNIEAMRAGLPIVSSDEGSISEMVINGLNGFIVNPIDINMLTDRVLTLVNNPSLRKNMGLASRKIYEQRYTIASYERRLKQGLNYFYELQYGSDGSLMK